MFGGFLMSMSNKNSHFPSQNRLQDRIENNQLLADTKYTFPVLFPYTPSALSLETVHIPASLSLDFLTRVWHLNLISVSLWDLPSQTCGLQRARRRSANPHTNNTIRVGFTVSASNKTDNLPDRLTVVLRRVFSNGRDASKRCRCK